MIRASENGFSCCSKISKSPDFPQGPTLITPPRVCCIVPFEKSDLKQKAPPNTVVERNIRPIHTKSQ